MVQLASGKVYKIISVVSAKLLTVSTANDHDDFLANFVLVESRYEAAKITRSPYYIKWRVEHIADEGWALKSLHQHEGNGLYLAYKSNNPMEKRSLIGTTAAYRWDIKQWKTRGGAEFRLWVHDAPDPGYVAEVAGGSDADGTEIRLWDSNDTASQFWLFQEVPN
ncbi:hypothetical protein BT96DRAFT_949384 [Gymnopus androsaceus JB14]|uniref:Uncharacterized protein n=1 Tax=Gymnopus androsaceus JB14 TaxID=1447944 RepID=A0A6A4GKB3_9AGAR|nr:hypothetical protein BT96DRAFT_949384 [Gymnopus androsaceus JB14]